MNSRFSPASAVTMACRAERRSACDDPLGRERHRVELKRHRRVARLVPSTTSLHRSSRHDHSVAPYVDQQRLEEAAGVGDALHVRRASSTRRSVDRRRPARSAGGWDRSTRRARRSCRSFRAWFRSRARRLRHPQVVRPGQPKAPITPTAYGAVSSTTPFPDAVVTTGHVEPVRDLGELVHAPPTRTPLPAITTGRSALRSTSATNATSSGSGNGRRHPEVPRRSVETGHRVRSDGAGQRRAVEHHGDRTRVARDGVLHRELHVLHGLGRMATSP